MGLGKELVGEGKLLSSFHFLFFWVVLKERNQRAFEGIEGEITKFRDR